MKFNMKKLISLVVCSLMVMTSCIFTSVSAAVMESNNDYTKISAVFQYAGMLDNEIGEAEFSSMLTRAEFADYLAKLMNGQQSESGVIYIDIPLENIYASSVNYLAKAGVVSVPEDLRFNPNDTITYDEALTMVVRASGYGVMAEANGGYPMGYRSVASRLGISISPIDASFLTVGEGLRILYNGATVGVYSPNKIGADGTYSYEVTGDTLLSIYKNIYIQRGKLYAASGSSINDKYSAKDNEANIDGLIYKYSKDFNAANYLGNNIDFVYCLDKANEIGELIYVEKSGTDKELEISSENFRSFDPTSFSLEYVKTGTDRKTSAVSVPRSVTVIYNGRPCDKSVSELINSLKNDDCHGTISLKDTDKTPGYDLMLIKCYTSVAVTAYTNNTLYNALNIGKNICTDDYEYMTIMTSDGLEAKMHTSFPYIADVAASYDKEKLEIIICSETVSGKLLEIDKSNLRLKLDGAEYEASESWFKNNENKISVGSEYTMYMNSIGKISYHTEKSNDEYKVGYLLKTTIADEGFGKKVKMRIFSHATGAFDIYTASGKLCVDEVQYSLDNGELMKALKAFPGTTGIVSENDNDNSNLPKVKPQLIRFKADDNNRITAVDTTALSVNENEENSLKEVRTTSKAVSYIPGQGRFDLTIVYNPSNTKVIVMPELDENGEMNINGQKVSDVEKYFSTSTAGMTDDRNWTMSGYNYSDSTPYTDVITYIGNAAEEKKNAMMFIDFSDTLDNDGMQMKAMNVNEAGAAKSYNISQNTAIPNDLTQGDLVGIRTGADGSVTEILLMYDRESGEYRDGSNGYVKDNIDYGKYIYNLPGYISAFAYRSVGRQLSKGYVYKKIGSYVTLTYELGDASFDGPGYENIDLGSRPVVIYDSTAPEKNRISNGSVNDIVDYKSAGNDCTYMLLNTYKSEGGGTVFIYK